MAPGVISGFDASRSPSQGYEIDKEAMFDGYSRKIKVLTIGAGISGIMMAYNIQKHCPNVEHVVYEKNYDIGGTWLENRYPNCACDAPSHAYIFNFAPNPEWNNVYSYATDVWAYLDRVCKVFDLRKYMIFNTKITGAYWEESCGQWRVTLSQTAADGSKKDIEEWCHVLLNASGFLNEHKWPNVPGLDRFKGRLIHTAAWPKDYQKEEWNGESVAVIGSGASSIQTVPGMQPYVKHIDIFVRTGTWFATIAGNKGDNAAYSEEEKKRFRSDPQALIEHCKSWEDQINGIWGMFYTGSPAQQAVRKMYEQRMAECIKDERLLKGFMPSFGVGCRRITPADPFMAAIQQDNVDVHFTAVGEITEDGLVGADGTKRRADTIICATGFDTSYRPKFPFVGQGGVDLREKWEAHPESYLGLGVPGFPNMVSFFGPTWPVHNGSVVGPLMEAGRYAVKFIRKIQNEEIHSISPRQDVTDAFNEHVQAWSKHTIWTDSCRSWYKDEKTGRVNAIWPGSSEHFIELIKQPRFEDYTITYRRKNMWSFLGLGNVPANITEGVDRSPYLSVDEIDPRWLAEIYGERQN
ncbi:4-hydroxyacetophenone monooxygenase [Nannizzia gypsea CBS 118893]|uniref:4-hydroxyacetophenone monooxygenase n=1 Tax=Arthroderma gypseum (strain ATCC MYA-4604 / CBS 118893) TaxID=535722 RepID=E5QYB8_ARTGP|nr:4-hydroxyacetophenone monooxygenase [Nannizzia gypsea CBS 118893]EFQ97210.1 4-hydroxyacetophenone monooxygenase [Nannizzia gypsea CBS 118893]